MTKQELPTSVATCLDQFKASLIRALGERVKDVRLFGSYARGDQRTDSDVDVLVLVEGATRADIETVIGIATDEGFVGSDYVVLSPFVRTPAQFAELRKRELRIALDIESEGIAV